MCGIAGVLRNPERSDSNPLPLSCDLSHRGPDDSGVWEHDSGIVAFAHWRLSILDLSKAGHQPMRAECGNAITYNGEIYNFREIRDDLQKLGHCFQSNCDTEVLLAAYEEWGEECLTRLRGMFVFAIWDESLQQLFLARDRAGQKPLFYTRHNGAFFFASEIKALLETAPIPRRLNPDALHEYFTFGYVGGQNCLLEGIWKLPPAHAMTVQAGHEPRIWRYWSLPNASQSSDSAEELVERLEQKLSDSVRYRLIADVPVGLMLSGGVDSSLLAVMAARHSSAVKSYCIGFPDDAKLDESRYARSIAEHVGLEHLELAAKDLTFEMLHDLAYYVDEPIADPSLLPTLMVSRLIRQHAKVALGGDGGDELFGGYLHYPWLIRAAQLRNVTPEFMRKAAARLATGLPVGFKGRTHILGLSGSDDNSIAHTNMYFDDATRTRLLKVPGRFELEPVSQGSTLQQATRMDFGRYLPHDILVKLDRASMATSLEVRAPWLDHHLIEFAFRDVPDHLKTTEKERKILPKMLAERILPDDFDLNRKQGFTPPIGEWLMKNWRKELNEIIDGASSAIFARSALDKLLVQQRKGRNNGHRIFAIVMFELWRKRYGVQV